MKIKRLVIFLVYILLLLVISDWALGYILKDRILKEPHPLGLYMKDESVGHVLTPGFKGMVEREEYRFPISINTNGERSAGPLNAGAEHEILCLGDSFAFGWGSGDSQAYPAVLEKLLNSGPQADRYRVINAGVNGYGTLNAAALLNKKYKNRDLDAIILSFYFNDVYDDANGVFQNTVYRGYLTRTEKAEEISKKRGLARLAHNIKFFLRTKSSLYLAIADFYNRFKKKIYRPHLSAPPEIPGTEATKAALLEIDDLAKKDNAQFIVLLIPSRDRVRFYGSGTIPEHVRIEKNITDDTRRFLDKKRIAYIDLLPVVLAEIRDREVSDIYFMEDGHFNPSGNAVIARTLADYLKGPEYE